VRITTLFGKLLGLQGLWVRSVRFGDGELRINVKKRAKLLTCPHCGKRKRGRMSSSVRSWRHLGLWGSKTRLEATIHRMRCPSCSKVVTEQVPWARHDSDFTRPFEDAVGLMAQKTDHTAIAALFGISWVTVGSIARRLVKELLDPGRFDGLRRISVDEISFRKHHRYLTVVTDHDRRRVIWVGEGKSSETLGACFEELGPERCALIEIITMDMSAAFKKAAREYLPNAQVAFDHFHIAQMANAALDEVRRSEVRGLKADEPAKAKAIKGMLAPTRYRLDNLPEKHQAAISQLRPTQPLGRAYLLKENLLDVLSCHTNPIVGLKQWMAWASRSRLEPFVKLSRTIRDHFQGIRCFLEHRVTNGIAEGMNSKIRMLSHRAFGFHSAEPLIATIYLCCGKLLLPELQLL